MGDTIRVLIAENHGVVRSGLEALLTTKSETEVVGAAKDGVEAVLLARSRDPDVILMDLVMPRQDGIEAIEEIIEENPDARILVLTSFVDDEKVFPAIKAGAAGYLLKDSSADELFQAILAVSEGKSFLDPAIAQKVINELNRPQEDLPPTEEPLTEREVEVLELVAQGRSNQDIAEALQISKNTVGNHISNILGKLHLANRTQAALYAIREGLVDVNSDGS